MASNVEFSGFDNPNWPELGYNPRETVNKTKAKSVPATTETGPSTVKSADRYLRRKVCSNWL